MTDPSIARAELLTQLYTNLKHSETAYREYLQGRKTFSKACSLRLFNERMRQLLTENDNLLGGTLQQDAKDLLVHYESWMQKWDDLKERLQPSPEDEFIFANADTFPRQAAINLEKEYLDLKNTGA